MTQVEIRQSIGQEAVTRTGFERYQELGGIINEQDYKKALTQGAQRPTFQVGRLAAQATFIARVSGIPLDDPTNPFNEEIINLYGVLRVEENDGREFHHSQMCDQALFVEALRMLDRADLVDRVIEAHPNIFATPVAHE